jgi:hypothetical protein
MQRCTHEKKAGEKKCQECREADAAYMRKYRRITELLAVRKARKEGQEQALRMVRVVLLEAGDRSLNGFTAAELVRSLRLD